MLLVQKRSLILKKTRTYFEGRTEIGYIFFVLWETYFCIAANGIWEKYLFPNASVSVLQATHLAGIHKLKNSNKKTL